MKRFLIIPVVFFAFLGCKDNPKMVVSGDDDLHDTTSIIINWDSVVYKIDSVEARLWGNQIEIGLNVAGGNDFYFEISNDTSRFKAMSSISQPSPTDCLYVSPQFQILNQSIILNKPRYKNADQLYGSLDILMLGKKGFLREPLVAFIDKRKWDTIRMLGIFSTRIN
jgi:hypothetical protein